MKQLLNKLVAGKNLTTSEAMCAQEEILSGKATPVQISAFLTALRLKGETLDEIIGLATVLRKKANNISPKVSNYVDLVGTGGDCTFSFNISTTSAFVVAAAGLPVAKHGNRSISSKCGSGDVLEALGVNICSDLNTVQKCVDEVGIGFMYAPAFNPAMKYVGGVRKELGVRTVFNILGPMANPSRAKNMLIGVYDKSLTEVIAKAMAKLGVERIMVVSGHDNMDEITLTGETYVTEIIDNRIKNYVITPEEYGFKRVSLDALRGGDYNENALITKNILQGKEKGPKRDIVLLNAGATLYIGKTVNSIEEGIELARKMIDNNKAYKVLENMIKMSNNN
ncbi:anthranilate phosphoribosyltransferase [Lachnobacterium bovis]|uniref:Anthranilate phosphoribosyltransferase n=1 Tax=Lachnobacterium bovis TaxID=140626 RepID=A0A1H9TW93_9FIRM|nr:anthranilate phosphoribosyltransferase [Lachnobacterium bovis]SES01505.1 anthranilate phosphoribosyltransferase [Lachnobacterium bovis]